jgi:hypothetical protein
LTYYLHFPWHLRARNKPQGWSGVSHEPIEEFRAWAWNHGVRYVLRRVMFDRGGKTEISMWIGFTSENDAMLYRMRWQ